MDIIDERGKGTPVDIKILSIGSWFMYDNDNGVDELHLKINDRPDRDNAFNCMHHQSTHLKPGTMVVPVYVRLVIDHNK